MQQLASAFERRTATDVVFDQLHEEIVSLAIYPGTKLSETEVAKRFGVSRQPVRDAFAKLENLRECGVPFFRQSRCLILFQPDNMVSSPDIRSVRSGIASS